MSRHGIYDMKYGFIPDDDCDPQPQPLTNADRIRSMTDDELAYTIVENVDCNRRCRAMKEGCSYSDSTCRSAWLNWLKQECE